MMFRRDAYYKPNEIPSVSLDCPRSPAIIYVNSGRYIDVIYVGFLSPPVSRGVYCKNN